MLCGHELEIEVDRETQNPTAAWEKLKAFNPVHQLPVDTFLQKTRNENDLRFVCMSDTHGTIESRRKDNHFHTRIPDGDVLIHCGDFTLRGYPSEVIQFDRFMSTLPHPVKLVIAGNHETTLEAIPSGGPPLSPEMLKLLGLTLESSYAERVAATKNLLQHVLYLEDDAIDICGIKIYGSPWVPCYGFPGFSMKRGHNLLKKWNQIPSDTNILITHAPPCGYGDLVHGHKQAGCVELLNTVVKRVKPEFHVFGHIHCGYGMWTNGTTTFINASVCNNQYRPVNDPIVFDFPLPKSRRREDFVQLSTEALQQNIAKDCL